MGMLRLSTKVSKNTHPPRHTFFSLLLKRVNESVDKGSVDDIINLDFSRRVDEVFTRTRVVIKSECAKVVTC